MFTNNLSNLVTIKYFTLLDNNTHNYDCMKLRINVNKLSI